MNYVDILMHATADRARFGAINALVVGPTTVRTAFASKQNSADNP